MAKGIKGITIMLEGETKGLQEALKDVNKESSSVSKELREVDKLLKFNPGNSELIEQKQKLLGDQVQVTSEKLKTLKDSEAEVQRQFEAGELPEEAYREFQREIVATEGRLDNFQGKLDDSNNKWKQFGDKSTEIGSKLTDASGKIKGVGTDVTKFVTGPLALAGGGIFALATKAGDHADRLLDLSDITGMSTDALQEWQYVAEIAGVDTESMSTAVEGLVRRIPRLDEEGGKATEALNKLGIEYKDLKNMSPDEQIDILMTSLSEMEDPLERNAVGSQLFGGAWKDLAPILGMGADEMANTRKEAGDLGLILSEETLNDANDFRQEMVKVTEQIQAVAFQLGSDLAPMLQDIIGPLMQDTIIPLIKDFASKIETLIEWFTDLSPETQEWILKIIALAAILGPMIVMLGFFVGALGSIFTALGTVLPLIGALLTFVGGIPLLLVAAIAAIVALGVIIYKNFDEIWAFIKKWGGKIIDIFVDTFNWVLDKVNGFIESFVIFMLELITDTIDLFIEFGTNMYRIITEMWDKVISSVVDFITDFLIFIKELVLDTIDLIIEFGTEMFRLVTEMWSKIIESIVDFIKSFIDFVKNFITNTIDLFIGFKDLLVNTIRDTFNNTLDIIKDIFGKIKDTISTIITTVVDFIKDKTNNIKTLFTDSFNKVFDSVKDIFGKVFNSIKDTMGDIFGNIKGVWDDIIEFLKGIDLGKIGKDMIQGMIDGVIDKAKDLLISVEDIIGNVVSVAEKILNIASPSKVFYKIGKFTGEGMEQGMLAMGGAVDKASQRMTENALNEKHALQEMSSTPSQGGGGTTYGETHINITGNWSVRSDQDIIDISRELKKRQDEGNRGRGGGL